MSSSLGSHRRCHICHTSSSELSKLLLALLAKLSRAKWVVNWRNSVIRPTKFLTFLGATWNSEGIERLPTLEDSLKQAINNISLDMKDKDKARIRGFLNYYLSFAGPVHSIVSRAFVEPSIGKTYLYQLLEVRKIKFKHPPSGAPLNTYADATPTRLGWIHEYSKGTAQQKPRSCWLKP